MAYIGKEPGQFFTSFVKQDFTTSATTSYTLDHAVANANELALFINFVRQEPTTAYTASGTTLTLTSATASTDDMYCVYLGKAIQTIAPASGSVGSSQVSADLITGQTALTSEPASTDELLISDAGTLKRIDYSLITNTPAFFARKVGSSDQSISGNTLTKITFDNELKDTNSNFASNKFTPTTAGTYFFTYQLSGVPNGSNMEDYYLYLYKNGSSIGNWSANSKSGGGGADLQDGQDNSLNMTYVDTANGTGDYYEVYGKFSEPFIVNYAHFGAYKLIGV